MKKVFVTVGTTKFPKLVDEITKLETLKFLSNLGYNFIQIQTGESSFQGIKIDPELNANVEIKVKVIKFNIEIQYNEYFENFEEEIEKADLVISHAGAGSCLNVLRLNKPLIIVINEDLMDNHQLELAEQLDKFGYCYYCTCNNLIPALSKNLKQLQKYPKVNEEIFPNYLDKCCGFGEEI